MRRWRLRLAVLGTGAALGWGASPTLSAWIDTTSNPTASVTSLADWVAPAVTARVIKSPQGGMPNYVRPSSQYRLCGVVGADSGSPASGLQSVVGNLSSLTAGLTNIVSGLLGGGSVCEAGDTYDSGARTLGASVNPASRLVTLTSRDNAGNTTVRSVTVTVDADPPAGTEFETINKVGGTAGRPESGDTVVYTYDEPIDPHALVPGWDGTGSQSVFAYIVQASGNDRLQIYRQSGATYPQLPLNPTNGYTSLGRNYVDNNVAFTSTMTVSGNDVRILLGTPDQPGEIRAADLGTTATAWQRGNGAFDYAGNAAGAGTLTESDVDTEF